MGRKRNSFETSSAYEVKALSEYMERVQEPARRKPAIPRIMVRVIRIIEPIISDCAFNVSPQN